MLLQMSQHVFVLRIWLCLVFVTHKMKLCKEFLLLFAVYKSSLTCLSYIIKKVLRIIQISQHRDLPMLAMFDSCKSTHKKNTSQKSNLKIVGSLYTYGMFTISISLKLAQAYYNAMYMYMLTWVVEYPKEIILLSSSQQLYFVFQWIRRSVFLEPF